MISRSSNLNAPIRSLADISGLTVTVMGLGLNGGGLEAARFLASRGASVTVTDLRDEQTLAPSIRELAGLPIRFVLGRHESADFSGADLVVKNPAVRRDSPYLAVAKRVETDISIFLRLCASPILAVTGSKGKSTVVSAIGHGFRCAGLRHFVGGNIAVSPLAFLAETGPGVPVTLELSSWQLADLGPTGLLKPPIAAITSILPDHQNYYGSMEAYVADKRLIYAGQEATGYTVCSFDDDWGRSFAAETPAIPFPFSEMPLPDGTDGAFIDGESGYLVMGKERRRILPERTAVKGNHARKNLLIAGTVLRLFGLEAETIAEAMATFPGVEHRLEAFAEKRGILCYNDSAATIPQALGAAIGAIDRPIILITGGTDKELDFSSIVDALRIPREIILLAGSGTEKLIPVIGAAGREYRGPFDSLEKAVNEAFLLARSGDALLLSPGCASFGMFLNEFDRGMRFKKIVSAY
jgi:UDP-N-acetylmuramoylalanine--D-glutamate ligase